jgi:hypothetical protein
VGIFSTIKKRFRPDRTLKNNLTIDASRKKKSSGALVFLGACCALVLITVLYWNSLLFARDHIPLDFWLFWGNGARSKAETLQSVVVPWLALVGLAFAIWRSYISWVQASTAGEQVAFLRTKQEEDRRFAIAGRFHDACEMLGKEDRFLKFAGIDALVEIANTDPEAYYVKSLNMLSYFVRAESASDTELQIAEEKSWEAKKAEWEKDFREGIVSFPPGNSIPGTFDKDKKGRNFRHYANLVNRPVLKTSLELTHALEQVSSLLSKENGERYLSLCAGKSVNLKGLRLAGTYFRHLNLMHSDIEDGIFDTVRLIECSFQSSKLSLRSLGAHVLLLSCNLSGSRFFCSSGKVDIYGSYIARTKFIANENALVGGSDVWCWSSDVSFYREQKRLGEQPASLRHGNTPQKIDIYLFDGRSPPSDRGWTLAPADCRRFQCEIDQLRGGEAAIILNDDDFRSVEQ